MCQRTLQSFLQLAQDYADKAHFVLIYNIEAHPEAPDISPYKGVVWALRYSTLHQPRNYTARVQNARQLLGEIQNWGAVQVVVDDFDPDKGANPFWCTYGTVPNGAFYLTQDRQVRAVEQWFNASEMEKVLKSDARPPPALV